MTDINIEEAMKNIEKLGYLDVDLDPELDLFGAINDLKKEKNAVILAHYYQEPDIQDIADFVGDSLGLSQEAAKTKADIILFTGVHFMAETAKILNPTKKVLLPDIKAGCSLADATPTGAFKKFKEDHPDHKIITYINCSAEIKALSDVICTSSNAEKIVSSFPPSQKLIFAPDKNLGSYLNKKLNREMILWNGACMVHEIFSLKKITHLKFQHPDALLISHPECEEPILRISDFIGSTTELLNFSSKSSNSKFIVATETGILHQMNKVSPLKTFIPAPPTTNCACNDCPYMKLNTLEKIYISLKYELPELILDDSILHRASIPMKRMLELS